MPKKLNFLIRSLMLVLALAFIMRPVAVYLQNGVPHSCAQQEGKAFAHQASVPHPNFRNIEREDAQVMVFAPGVSKVKVPSLLVGHLNPVFAPSSTSSKSSTVLRI